ncbi:MAG: hypothetical protein CFE21_18330 [Bacteroidetes bacterium B1(2017)]|nr:MAG: hypothetical protein CFE21_18330 [Bacteroidetes bacterium B1(2017)]
MKRYLPNFNIFIIFLLTLLSFKGVGQVCGTFKSKIDLQKDFALFLDKKAAETKNLRINSSLTYIPLKIWFKPKVSGEIPISLTEFNKMLAFANQVFLENGLQFYLYEFGTNNTISTNQEIFDLNESTALMLFNQKNTTHAINVYLFDKINVDGEPINGAAYFPSHESNLSLVQAFKESEMNCLYFTSTSVENTLAHELGHYLGLYHTFAHPSEINNCEIESLSGDNQHADFIDETPADFEPKGAEYDVKYSINSICQFKVLQSNASYCGIPISNFTPPIDNLMGYWQKQNKEYCAKILTPKQYARVNIGKELRLDKLQNEYDLEGIPDLNIAPTSLIALKSVNNILLTWNDLSTDETGFILERSLSPNLEFAAIAGLGPNQTSYVDQNLPQNITYYYRIRYSNSITYSNTANSASNYVFPPTITNQNTTINAGDNIQLSATGCVGGIIHWSNSMTGNSINVSPILLTGYTAYCQLNGYYSSPSNAVVIKVNYENHLSSAEFFIDQDPGIGKSLPLSLSFSGGLIDQTVPINLKNYQLPQGVHSIGIRVKDENDKWSLTHTKTFLILGFSSGNSNNIADVEYFIDSLKQDKSNLISTGISANNDATISIPVIQNIPQGVHSIAFRVKDNQGKYSLFHTKTYLVLGSEPGSNVLSKIEYFFDSDPGFGLGTQVNYTSVSGETQVIDINTNGLSSGVHVLNVRVKNIANQWSLTHAKVFLVMPDLGGTATVSKIEYFIDDNDPGPGVANNVAYTPNPDNKNVVANFDLDVNTYTPGIHRISARVLDSEGRWSPVVAKAFEFFPPISIVALSEINELSYTLPKESTIHHYYVAKTTNGDKPVPGVVINYQVGPDPTVRKSEPSDQDGIVDLNIKTGGDNLTSNIDDWIKVFNNPVPVQYIGIDKFSIVNSNQFFTNPFTVTLKEKAEPTEKAVEIGLGVSIKAAAADLEKYEKKSKVGNAEFAVGPKLGASIMLGPSLSYQQSETNPSVWHVKSRIGIGAEGEAGVEASIESGKFSAELNGSINAEIATTPGIYFDFNKDNARQVFELVKNMFLSNSFVPVGIYKAANFFRRASIDDYFPPSPLTFTGGSIGASLSGSINGEFGITYNAGTVANFPTYAKWLQAGGSLKLSGSRNMGVEIEAEKIKNEGRSLSIKTYSGVEMAEEYELLTNLTRRGALNWWKATLPFKSYSSSKQNANTLINYYSNDDDLLDTKVNQSSQKTISVNGLQTLNVTYNNITTFGPEARGRMLVAKDNALLGNSIANFMFSNRPTYFNYVNNFVTGLPLQSFSQSFLDAKNYIINNFDPNWSSGQFSHEITRDYSIEQPALAVEIPKLASKVGEFKFNVANNYSFDLEKSKFSKTYKRIFPTISLADNESNLDLSFSNPVQELFTNLKTNTEALPQNLFDKFMDFVIPVKQYLNNFLVCVGNGGCPSGSNAIASGESKTGAVIRKDLNANVIYDGSTNTKNTSSAQNTQPSLMNFTVGPSPQVFATGTELYFDYYYPENNLMAITASDTMRIVSDVFTLFANLNGTELNQAPNGNFTVNTTWNSNDLELAGMPQNLVPKIIFKPNGASTWQIIGDVNQTINFNQLGVFAFGVSLENDLVPPTIAVQAPSTFTQGQIMTINISDNLSGINWNNTSIFINGIAVAYTHTGSQIQLTLPASADNTYFVQVLTYDFSFNYKSYERVYPCAVSLLIRSLEGRSDAPIIEKVSNFIEIDTQVPGGKDIILNAGKNIVFKPGFRIEAGQVMTAEVKGCEN